MTLLFLLIIIAIWLAVFYFSYQVEDMRIPLLATRVVRYRDSERTFWAILEKDDGTEFMFEKWQLNESDEIWENLQVGQTVILHHYLEYWPIFGKKIVVKKHVDVLKPNEFTDQGL